MNKYFIVILVILGALLAAFISGCFFGRSAGREAMLKAAVKAFENREIIDNETADLGRVDMCIALGGLPDECVAYMRGLDEAAKVQ